MNLIEAFPTLFSNSTNGTMQWTIKVYDDDGLGVIKTEYGLMTGKMQYSKQVIFEGKNIGKRNETTPVEQAINEAQSKWNKKFKTSFETLEELDKVGTKFLQPMTAKKYKNRKHKVKLPCYVQPKLDGVRCIANEVTEDLFPDIKYTSRSGMRYMVLSGLDSNLSIIFDKLDVPTDGEIYTHDIHFEEIVSAVRNNKPSNILKDKLQYWIYDIVDTDLPFNKRYDMLLDIFMEHGEEDILKQAYHIGNVYLCPTYIVESHEDIMMYHKHFVSAGYEGTMIRNYDGKYKASTTRSDDLLKLKDFVTEEYEIVDIIDGIGNNAGLAIYVCKLESGKRFRVTPEASHEDRAYIYQNKNAYIGKLLTVRYQALTRYGIPKCANGITIRDYE